MWRRVISFVTASIIALSPLTATAKTVDDTIDISISDHAAVTHMSCVYKVEKPIDPVIVEDVPTPEEPTMSDEDIELIALVTMAEAEGECELGKRLVIDTILNRVDHETKWPDTVYGVIYQPHQFTSMWNGRVDRCEVREDIVQLVREELVSRTNSECVYFRTTRYSDYGKPLFQVESHYFSKV